MSRLQSIENALAAIDQGRFQNLCDSYLAIRNQNYRAFSRTGSQSGKQKTIKGTPDSFLLLPNGRYIFVEYSTNVSAGASKIEDDIKKCLDDKKTGISKDQLSEIIICLNFNLNTKEVGALVKLLSDTRIRLSIETLDSLALEIHLHHRNLAHEYLGLPLDTGQIVSIDQFVKEYDRKGSSIATPLDNTFIERKSEQEQLTQAINASDFIIVTGPPGVGKTKLCIETIRLFLEEHLSYQAYCVSYKTHTLLDDLFQYLDAEKDFILFVDDANRIDAFSQITGFYQATRSGQLKIVVTVRDYAFTEIGTLAADFDPIRVDIGRLTDEQIDQIIESKPFEVHNSDYKEPIKRIADGNPRLAIMASLLAKREQNPIVLADVSDLFEKYYTTFIKDKDEFASELNIKCLGLIAFFYTIPYKDRKVTEPILLLFGFSYNDFIDAIDKLDKLELVEIQFEHIKIPEQNLSTYFFYKAFIQEELLSFKTLLENYFQSNQARFKDCIIPANNTFGPERVMKKLQPFLRVYWKNIRNNWDQGYKFLSTFWFYMQEEALEFILVKVNDLPIPKEPKYEVQYETNDSAYNHDEIIDLLGDFLRFESTMSGALELLFEYVKKKPEHLPELIHEIKEILMFDSDDWRYRFERQFILFRYLIEGVNNKDYLLACAFFELAKNFLGFKFHHTKGGRNHSIVMYQFHMPNESATQSFRSLIWDTFIAQFSEYSEWAFDSLESYCKPQLDVIKEIMQQDVPKVLLIINSHLTPDSFIHCKYVQEQIRWCRSNGVEHEGFSELAKKFTNPLYERYLILDWDRLRDKESFDFDDYRDYERIKERQIRDSIKLLSKEEIEQFYNDFIYLRGLAKNNWGYSNVLAIVIDETMNKDIELGYAFLELIIDKGNEVGLVPGILFRNVLHEESHANRLWELLNNRKFKARSEWKMAYLLGLDDKLLSSKQSRQLVETIEEGNDPVFISFEPLKRYLKFDDELFQKIIEVIYKKNEMQDTRITVWGDLFIKQFDLLGNNLDLIKNFYIQQRIIQNHFDLNLEGLKRILRKDPSFLIEYVSGLYVKEQHQFIEDHHGFGFIWEFENAEYLVQKIFELVREKVWWFGIRKHYCNAFYNDVKIEYQSRADKFLIDFVKENYTEPKKINEVVDIARHARKEVFETILLTYIELNQKVEDFSNIKWIGSGGTYSGDVIIGDIRAASWKNILAIVEESELGIKLLPIKRWINEVIEGELINGDWERRRRFLERY